MQARDYSKLATTRVMAALKVGATVAVLGFIVVMTIVIERPLSAATNDVGSVSDEVSFMPDASQAANRADAQRDGDNTGDQLAASKRLPMPWNFAAPGGTSDSQPATF